jgi:hypothetical protein
MAAWLAVVVIIASTIVLLLLQQQPTGIEPFSTTTAATSGYKILPKTGFRGATLKTLKARTAATCVAACDADAKCKAFSIGRNPDANGVRTCWLKGADAARGSFRAPDIDKTSYVKQQHWEEHRANPTDPLSWSWAADQQAPSAMLSKDKKGRVCYGFVAVHTAPNFGGNQGQVTCGEHQGIDKAPSLADGVQSVKGDGLRRLWYRMQRDDGLWSEWTREDIPKLSADWSKRVRAVEVSRSAS